ncbi:SOS response-associated peptidase [Allosaccharopolyspora coralli]|uniref:Abasic site processing protein n=1 Tax=Allosaccharopolyspora coralli TaxID=2665642 RepID=A0A5Q3QLV6_9PSEU|nr:SOS response-associated peptidase [Allosaccharopolyspora coralli]QGK72399.1 SOS response-associated peptidase [Allosaccharopolyspora coralli]
MCGRYAVRHDPAMLAHEFDAFDRTEGEVAPDFNVSPTRTVPVVVQRGRERTLRPVRWGLVPTWAKDTTSGPPMINARAESITTKPAYAESVAHRRCLMPATGWFEWSPGDRTRQPHLCGRSDGASLGMAAVFSAWWPQASEAPLVTCAVVTTEAVGEFADVHHRMPLVLPRRRWQEWLDPESTDVAELLSGVDSGVLTELELRPVSPEVNSIRNNHPGLLERVAPAVEPQPALFES